MEQRRGGEDLPLACLLPWPQSRNVLVQVTFSSSILSRTELEEPHNYDTTISYLSQSSNSINLCAAGETTDGKSAKPINSITL